MFSTYIPSIVSITLQFCVTNVLYTFISYLHVLRVVIYNMTVYLTCY